VATKLSHHPTREEMKRLRERWDREDAEEMPLKPFDVTLTEGLDDTVQHLRIMRDEDTQYPNPAADRLRSDAIERLTTEARTLRKGLADVIETLNHKASKRLMAKSLEENSTKLDKRIDNIFKLVTLFGSVVALLVTLVGIVIAVKAH
jgi:hypothetical protein